jgi:hypothetical protein
VGLPLAGARRGGLRVGDHAWNFSTAPIIAVAAQVAAGELPDPLPPQIEELARAYFDLYPPEVKTQPADPGQQRAESYRLTISKVTIPLWLVTPCEVRHCSGLRTG